jgi:hypothetical protein
MLRTYLVDSPINYDGSQLSPRWIERQFNLAGDVLVTFPGACEVKPEYMVDLEDLQSGSRIAAAQMLHFIGEIFEENPQIEKAVLWQRSLVYVTLELLRNLCPGVKLIRQGDDLFCEMQGEVRKLSISVATMSSTSLLFHFGVNISQKGVPVKAVALEDLKLDPSNLAQLVLQAFQEEYESIKKASLKVRILE